MKKIKQFKPSHRASGAWEADRKFNGRAKIDAMYDLEWEKYRLRFLKINHLCYSCGEKSTVVDHLTPHKGDEILFKKTDNHIPLCFKCHNTVTALFDRNYVRGNPIDPKLNWLSQNRINYDCYLKVKVLPSYEG